MPYSENVSIFRTNKVPVTHISQNHLDALHTVIDSFCQLNKGYSWHLIGVNGQKIKGDKAIAHIDKREPRTLHYLISSKSFDRELLIDIDNGITVNLKNGSYLLYALYALVNDTVDIIKVPLTVVYLRRYWLLNTLLAGWFIPALIFLIFSRTGGAIFWLFIFPFGLLMLTGMILNEKDNFIEKLEWEDVVLSTKIQYKKYHSKAGSPILSLLTSTKAMVSIAASLATILSFIFYLVQR